MGALVGTLQNVKKMVNAISIIYFIVIGLVAQSFAEPQAFQFKRLVHGEGEVLERPVVIVAEGRIQKVIIKPSDISADINVLDLSELTAIPGLIDVHTHITYAWDGNVAKSPWIFLGEIPSATLFFYSEDNAQKTLQAGVTTIRDLSAKDFLNIQMRDLIAKGQITGPRILAAGYGLYPTSSITKPGYTAPAYGRADGITEIMRAVREQIAAGADWVKLFGSTGSANDTTDLQTFTYEEIEAAVKVAHQMGRRVAFHSYGPDAARDAVRAGVDSIEHAVGLDKKTLREMVKKNIFYVPTIYHNRYYIDNSAMYGYDNKTIESLKHFIQRNLETTKLAYQLGVRIAMGSDAVFNLFGQNSRELEWLVKAGMTPAKALSAATVNGALLLGMENKLGEIKPGYEADIVAIKGDPLTDITVLTDGVRWVMKQGEVVVDNVRSKNYLPKYE